MTLFLLFSLLLANSSEELPPTLDLDLKNALVSPYPNTLKMYSIALDPVRHLVYTVGSQTPHIAVVDLQSGQQVQSLLMPVERQLAVLKVNPQDGRLLVLPSSGTPRKAYLLSPEDSTVLGSFSFKAQPGAMAFSQDGRIFVVDQQEVVALEASTLRQLFRFNPGLGALGGIALLNEQLWVGSRNLRNQRISLRGYKHHSSSVTRIASWSFPATEALGEFMVDQSRNRLLMLGLAQLVVVDLRGGAVVLSKIYEEEANDAVYLSSDQTLVRIVKEGYLQDGEQGIWAKILLHSLETGTLQSFRGGDYAAQIIADEELGLLAWPSMHGGTVDLAPIANPAAYRSVDIGESLDDLVVTDEALFMLERLGGSRMVRLDRESGELSICQTGRWPCVIRHSPSLKKLFVLNHYASSVGVHDASSGAMLEEWFLPMPEGRTDAIGVMALDEKRQRIHLCLPENEAILCLDAATGKVLASYPVPGLTFDSERHAAIGVVQLATLPTNGDLLVFLKDGGSLYQVDALSGQPHASNRVSVQSEVDQLFLGSCLQVEAQGNKVFVGGTPFLLPGLQRDGTSLAQGQYLGTGPEGTMWFLSADEEAVLHLSEWDEDLHSCRASYALHRSEGAGPVAFWDGQTLYCAEFNYARLRAYPSSSR
jgi:DNA-binding beta-propeller fold protein YncE